MIAALGDNRARLAIYALRQAMAELPAERVIAHLQNVPMEKVTVAKETIRLVGEFGGSAGFDWLVAIAKRRRCIETFESPFCAASGTISSIRTHGLF